mmetsp:Transcript_16236/g.35105  ORF Transcript_16236/g.35105 Transcript_16236/m.35105 type:complete len:87 (-) Transcript_16236:802-1062(-)
MEEGGRSLAMLRLRRGDRAAAAAAVVEPTTNRAAQTARRNNATRATFTNDALSNPFTEGGFRWVAKGVYTHGARAGETCVCKWFKS